jgi:hypothetical protein
MTLPIKRLKNTTGGDLLHSRTGVNLVASSYTTIDLNDALLMQDDQMWEWFDTGSIIFNNGTSDVTNKYEGFAKLINHGFGIPFLSDPDRVNSFTSKDVQNAIEEGGSKYKDVLQPFAAFVSNGNVGQGKWLWASWFLDSENDPSFVYTDMTIKTIYTHCGGSTTVDIGIYDVSVVPYVLLYTVTLTSQSERFIENLSISLSKYQKIAAKVISGSANSPSLTIVTKWT